MYRFRQYLQLDVACWDRNSVFIADSFLQMYIHVCVFVFSLHATLAMNIIFASEGFIHRLCTSNESVCKPVIAPYFCNAITLMKYDIYLIDFSCNWKVDQKYQYYCQTANKLWIT